MNAVDTNILIYVRDPRDPRKQSLASELVENLPDAVLLWQVACEYLAVSRKLKPFGYDFDQSTQFVRELMAGWTTAYPTAAVLDRAIDLLNRYSLSFWDALVLAACCEANVTMIYSEDFGGPRRIDDLYVVNPFVVSAG